MSNGCCLSLLILYVFLAAGESFFRVIGFNFAAREEEAWRRQPIYFRQPIVPTGSVFFRRPGPEQWIGQVLRTEYRSLGAVPDPHADEPVITAAYDRRGFRNPDPMTDWGIAVAGDSFTEQGYLAYEQLFTSVLARELDVAVLNLGTSHTGPLAQLSYLEDYGVAAATRHAVIVFFEGNDLEDLAGECKALTRWEETGHRETREFGKQSSFLRAVNKLVWRARHEGWFRAGPKPGWIHAYFTSSEGDIPVRLGYAPPGGAQLPSGTLGDLDRFFRRYAGFQADRHVTAWLAYMPCKERVLHGRIAFTADAPGKVKAWQPTDLPEVVSGLCARHGIGFIDLTPALAGEARDKRLPFNAVDTHLNAQGSLVVGRELARRLHSPGTP